MKGTPSNSCSSPRQIVVTAVLLFGIVSLGVVGQAVPQRWVQAERDIPRLAPETYVGLPRPIARYLRRHGYTIPQSYDIEREHNAVRGRFSAGATQDWAVLASRGGYSEILVFWGGSATRLARLARRADISYLQTIGGDKIGYSRRISTVGRKYIVEHHREYGGPKPPQIQHDAIDDAFSGKASTVYYFDGRRWRRLQGAD